MDLLLLYLLWQVHAHHLHCKMLPTLPTSCHAYDLCHQFCTSAEINAYQRWPLHAVPMLMPLQATTRQLQRAEDPQRQGKCHGTEAAAAADTAAAAAQHQQDKTCSSSAGCSGRHQQAAASQEATCSPTSSNHKQDCVEVVQAMVTGPAQSLVVFRLVVQISFS